MFCVKKIGGIQKVKADYHIQNYMVCVQSSNFFDSPVHTVRF